MATTILHMVTVPHVFYGFPGAFIHCFNGPIFRITHQAEIKSHQISVGCNEILQILVTVSSHDSARSSLTIKLVPKVGLRTYKE